MEKYIFILGRNSELSIVEIESVLKKNNIDFNLIAKSREVTVIETAKSLDISLINKALGGTVKIGEVLDEKEVSDDYGHVISDELLNTLFPSNESKVEFGISIYDLNGDRKIIETLTKNKFQTTKTIKIWLDQKNIKAHFPQSSERFLSSAAVDKNKLIERGAEILIIVSDSLIFVGKTLAVQEFEEFSFRDYGRPKRDMKSGVMPPKLARIMINLAEVSEGDVLLDPFCGSGTVIQEALYLGYKNIIGSDNSKKAIDDTKENINWFKNNIKNIDTADAKIDIYEQDASTISKKIPTNSVSAIVTEPYLGQTMHRRPQNLEIEKAISNLKPLYLSAFSEFKKILKPGGVVVFILPAFFDGVKIYNIEILDQIKKLGLKQESLSNTSRQSVIVGGRQDFVLREIVKFTS